MNNNYNNQNNNNIINNVPQQPIYNNPEPEKKKSKVGIIIGMVLVLALGILVFLFLSGGVKDKFGGSNKKSDNFVAPKAGETHKGIVYLDPTDLAKKCTEQEVNANVNEKGTPTGINTGCMRFYIFDDSGDTYKMILDHNTTAFVPYNTHDDGTITNYKELFAKDVIEQLEEDTQGWLGNPRLITADEVAHIVGIDKVLSWDSSKQYRTEALRVDDVNTEVSWFLFVGDGKDYSKLDDYYNWQDLSRIEKNNIPGNEYGWLATYTYSEYTQAHGYGSQYPDSNHYTSDNKTYQNSGGYVGGYWTSTTVNYPVVEGRKWTLYSNGYAYAVNYADGLGVEQVSKTSWGYRMGVRPVIELKKSSINK